MAENKTSIAILGILAVLAIIGLVMMLQGVTGKVTYWPVATIEPSAEKACSIVDCNYGKGGIVVGEEGSFWLCACPNQFADRNIADWGSKEAKTVRDFPNTDNIWRISKIRTY